MNEPGTTEVNVPDIGDFIDVPVIEVLVKPGDQVRKDDSLIVLESEKATMEVPSPLAGTVREIRIQAGQRVSQGVPILTLVPLQEESGSQPASPKTRATPDEESPTSEPEETEESAEIMEGTAAEQSSAPAAVTEIRVPDIGDFHDVPVIEILAEPGAALSKETPLVTLESEKAAMEVPSPVAGTLEKILVRVGDKVSAGSPLATVRTAGAPEVAQTKHAAQPRRQQHEQEPQRPQQPLPPSRERVPSPGAAAQISQNGALHASPSIRRFARELGVDLRRVSGSGPRGRLTREDVQQFVKSALSGASGGGSGLSVAAWPKVDYASFGPVEMQPLSRIKKIAGPALHRNWVMIPHVTNNEDADITELEEFRRELNAEGASEKRKVTILAFLMRAVVSALQHFPEFNASLDGETLVLKKYYNIGFAADTPAGLVVPVITGADKKGVLEIAAESAALAAKARDGKLTREHMQGGTFTISSLGGIGGTYFTPIINAPEVAILGASRAAMRPFWDGKKFEPRLILPLSLSYDHRVIDGAAAARFNAYLVSLLADMRRTML